MAESVDAADSKSVAFTGVLVQVRPGAPSFSGVGRFGPAGAAACSNLDHRLTTFLNVTFRDGGPSSVTKTTGWGTVRLYRQFRAQSFKPKICGKNQSITGRFSRLARLDTPWRAPLRARIRAGVLIWLANSLSPIASLFRSEKQGYLQSIAIT